MPEKNPMPSNQSQNTTSILSVLNPLQQLSTVQLHLDGVSVKGLGSIRLSNFPGNLSGMATSVSRALSLSSALQMANAATSYFSIQDVNKEDINSYALVISHGVDEENSVVSAINNGACGVSNTVVSDTSLDPASLFFKVIKEWGEYNEWPDYHRAYMRYASFWRGPLATVNNEVEACVESLMQKAVESYQRDQDELAKDVIIGLGAVTSAVTLACVAYCLVKKYGQRQAQQHSDVENVEVNERRALLR